MPLVPSSIQTIAANAAALQASKPINDCAGIQLAERLKAGTITDADIEKMHRFFSVNSRNVGFDEQCLRTADTSALVRSWELHGGHPAKVWVERLIKGRAYEAHALTPITELFDLLPDQVYAKFSLGAWRYEYGLSPTGAARFVEEYQRATGFFLDYKRAFGDASDTIIANMYRRAMPRSPSLVIAECLQSDDVVLRTAAELDAESLCASELDEAIYPKATHMDAKAAAKIVWAPFVAFFILAVEAPKLLEPLIGATQKPPSLEQAPKVYSLYSDVENTYIAYFHPTGSRYVNPSDSKDFVGVDDDVFQSLRKAYFGVPQTASAVKKMLGKARRWMAENGLAGSLFHIFNADWGKANWDHILENLPVDSDIYVAFSTFAKSGAVPSLALKTIETVSDKAIKEAVIKRIATAQEVPTEDVKPVQVSTTKAAAAAAKRGTLLSVYGLVLDVSLSKKLGHLGAWAVNGKILHAMDMLPSDKKLDTDAITLWNDTVFANKIADTAIDVIALHMDLPGTTFTKEMPTTPTKPLDHPVVPAQSNAAAPNTSDTFQQTLTDPDAVRAVKAFLVDRFNLSDENDIENIPFKDTAAADAAYKHGKLFGVLSIVKLAPSMTLAYLGAWKTPSGTWHVLDKEPKTDKVLSIELATRSLSGLQLDIDDGSLQPTGTVKVLTPFVDATLPTLTVKAPEKEPQSVAALYSVAGSHLLFVGFDKKTSLLARRIGNTWSVFTNQHTVSFADYAKMGAVKQLDQIPPDKVADIPKLVGFAIIALGAGIASPGKVAGEPFQALVDGVLYDIGITTGFGGAIVPQFVNKTAPKAQDTFVPITPVAAPQSPDNLSKDKPVNTWTGNMPPNGSIIVYAEAMFGLFLDGTFYKYGVKHPSGWHILETPTVVGSPNYLSHKEAKVIFNAGVPVGAGQFAYGLVKEKIAEYPAKNDDFLIQISGKSYNIGIGTLKGATVPTMVPTSYTVDKSEDLPAVSPKPTAVYEPPAQAPASVSDPSDNTPEMFGTPEALAVAEKKGFTPAVKSDSALFLWDLGDVRQYTENGYRTIVGYGFAQDEEKTAVYFILTDEGNTTFKIAEQGNKSYKKKVGMSQEVIDSLVPVPGSKAVELPKLNYKLCEAALKVAKEYKTVFLPAPTEFSHHPGILLAYGDEAKKVRFLGWATGGTGEPTPLLQLNPDDPITSPVKTLFSQPALVESSPIWYETKFKIDNEAGEVDIAKVGTANEVIIYGGSLDTYSIDIGPGFANSNVELSDDYETVKEPPLDVIPKGKHLSAGIIMAIPGFQGITMYADDGVNTTTKIENEKPNCYWLVLYRPLGNYAGYDIAIPKGTVNKGETMVKAAIREVKEETGILGKPLRFLGDYHTSGSVTRLYLGLPVKGNPKQKKPKHEECDAVLLRKLVIPPEAVHTKDGGGGKSVIDYVDVSLLLSKNKWIQKLKTAPGSHWQITAVCDAARMLAASSHMLQLLEPEPAEAALPCAVSTPVSSSEQFDVPTFAKETEGLYIGPSSLSYLVGRGAHNIVKAKMDAHEKGTAWGYVDNALLTSLGYPKAGVDVSYKTKYDHTENKVTILAYFQAGDTNTRTIYMAVRFLTGDGLHKAVELLNTNVNTGAVIAVFTPASVFKLLSMQEAAMVQNSAPVVEAPTAAPTEYPDWLFWKSAMQGFPFPVSVEAVKELAKVCEESGVLAVKAEGSAQGKWKNQQFGSAYEVKVKGILGSLFVIGYVTVTVADGSTTTYALVYDHEMIEVMVMVAGKVDINVIHAPKTGSPLFTHPDPQVNAAIVAFANGGEALPVAAMQKYCKASGVPAWEMVNAVNAPYVAALFDTTFTDKFANGILATLKSLKKESKAKYVPSAKPTAAKGVPPAEKTPPPLSVLMADEPAIKPKGPKVDKLSKGTAAWDSPDVWSVLENPDPSEFTQVGEAMKSGTKPNATLSGFGRKWFFKWYDSNSWRAQVDRAASLMCAEVVGTTVPVGALTFGGRVGSIQPLVENSKAVPDKASDLTETQQAAVLAQHAVDMFIGDHDGHAANWLLTEGGRVVPIDRGQAFKGLLTGVTESLDPHWTMPTNSCEAYAKRLLIEWEEGKATIKASGWNAMATAIEKIMSISDSRIEAILYPVWHAQGRTVAQGDAIVQRLKNRRDSYAKDWTTVLKKLRPDFQWPTPPEGLPDDNPPQDIPGDPKHGIEKEHAATIKEAVKAGMRGKVLKMDSQYIENNDVMITPIWFQKGVDLVAGTMLRWRFTKAAQTQVVMNLSDPTKNPQTQLESDKTQAILAVDLEHTEDVWKPLLKATKSINYHCTKVAQAIGDGKYNKTKIDAVIGKKLSDGTRDINSNCVIATLNAFIKHTNDGSYTDSSDSPKQVKAMAVKYMDYAIAILQAVVGVAEGTIVAPLPIPVRYVPTAEPKEAPKKSKKQYTAKLTSYPAMRPQLSDIGGKLVTSGFEPTPEQGSSPSAYIKSPGFDAQIMLTELNGAESNRKGYNGSVWVVIEAEPNAKTVARAMRIIEDATGINTKPATNEEKELTFLANQLLPYESPEGIVRPNSSSEAGRSKGEAGRLHIMYNNKKIGEAIEYGRNALAKQLGMDVSEMMKDPRYNPSGVYPMGEGYPETTRMGFTVKDIRKVLGNDIAVAHGFGKTTMDALIEKARNNAMFMSINQRIQHGMGLNQSTGSKTSDVHRGGSQGVFCALRYPEYLANHMYFDISVMLRTDAYIVGPGNGVGWDSYGETENPRYMTPKSWADAISESGGGKTGECNSCTVPQVNIRHGIDLRKYLIRAVCANGKQRDTCIQIVTEQGWVFAEGRKAEDIFVVSK